MANRVTVSLTQYSDIKTEVSLLKINLNVNFSEAHHGLCPETSNC